MTSETPTLPMTHWLALRLATGLTQREVERRLGWEKRGHLSLIERGVTPSPTQAQQLREFYGAMLTAKPEEARDGQRPEPSRAAPV